MFTLITHLQTQNIKCVTEEISLYSPKIRKGKKKKEKTLQNSFPVSHRPFNQLPEHRNVRPAPSTEGIPIRTSLVHLAAGFHAYRFAENRFKSGKRQDLAKAKRISIIHGGISSLFLMMERSQFTSDVLFARVFVVAQFVVG